MHNWYSLQMSNFAECQCFLICFYIHVSDERTLWSSNWSLIELLNILTTIFACFIALLSILRSIVQFSFFCDGWDKTKLILITVHSMTTYCNKAIRGFSLTNFSKLVQVSAVNKFESLVNKWKSKTVNDLLKSIIQKRKRMGSKN